MAILVRAMAEADLAEAWRIHRLAFGTHFGLPDPMAFRGDSDAVRARFRTNPAGAVAAEADGRLVGGGFVMDWGSVGVLGPLFVEPADWSRGIGHLLMTGLVERIEARGHAFVGLITFPGSASHVRLYEAFGFAPQRMIAVMERPTPEGAAWPAGASLMSETGDAALVGALCRTVADAVWPGLDLGREIAALAAHGWGDVVLIGRGEDEGGLAGFALCHHGAGSEGGSDQLFVKFGAVRPGADAAADCLRLIEAAEALARRRGAAKVVAGTNAGRAGTYRILRERGYRAFLNGIAMLRPPGEGYGTPEAYAFDDWR